MTRELAKELATVIAAFGEGKTIRFRNRIGKCKWEDVVDGNPSFSSVFEYQIKPEPREFWINMYADGDSYLYGSKASALNSADSDRPATTIRVREVL